MLNSRSSRLVYPCVHASCNSLPLDPSPFFAYDQPQEVSSDGRSASVTVTPTLEAADAMWCVRLHPARQWSPVGTLTTAVDGPRVTSGKFAADLFRARAPNPEWVPYWTCKSDELVSLMSPVCVQRRHHFREVQMLLSSCPFSSLAVGWSAG